MDKQEQIEEMARELREIQPLFYASIAEQLYNAGYRKIPENAVVIEKSEYDKLRLLADECLDWRRKNCNVGELPKENAVAIPKEISCYENIEKRVRTFRIDGNNVDFTDEQIMAITSIFNYKEMQAEEIRKETAEKFAERLFDFLEDYALFDKRFLERKIDEILKEITER